jgi:hypothetical protein
MINLLSVPRIAGFSVFWKGLHVPLSSFTERAWRNRQENADFLTIDVLKVIVDDGFRRYNDLTLNI